MDYHEWAPRSAEPPDPPDRRAAYGSDEHRAAHDPYGPNGRSAERIDDLDDWSGPITGSGHAGARPPERDRSDLGYWDERYAERDSGAHATGRAVDRPVSAIPAMRTSDEGHTSTSWRTGSAVAPERAGGSRSGRPTLGTFDDDRDYPAVLGWTAIWYAVPVVMYFVWALTRSGAPKAFCVGASECTSARSDAWESILHNSFGVILALLISFGVAALIRRVSLSWRALTLGFAAAVIGTGIATLLLSVF